MLYSRAHLSSRYRVMARPGALAFSLAAAFGLALPVSSPAQDQDSFTPMPLDAGFGTLETTAPSIPPAEIIQRFTAKESEFQEALRHYTYVRTATIATINDYTRRPDGEWSEVDNIVAAPDGSHIEQTLYAPPSTLRRIALSPSDLQDIEHGFAFVLTAADVSAYNIVYVGRQKVDEITCYVFDVSPRQILKSHRYLLGRIWVDDRDLQILITNGRMIPDDTRKGREDLHPPFMTWREQIDGRYWFPTYVRGEGILHFAPHKRVLGADVHIREIIKYTSYKRSSSPAQPQPSSAPPP